MKKRIISAIVLLSIFIPVLIIGGNLFYFFVNILALIGLKEFIDIKETRKKIPVLIKFLSFLLLVLMLIDSTNDGSLNFMIDYRIISAVVLIFLIPVVFYQNSEKYSINDAFFLIGGIFFLSASFSLLLILRSINIYYLIYLLLITTITDTYAFFTGYYIGRHQMIAKISPKKTWEGFIGGTIMGVFIPTVFFTLTIPANMSLPIIILMTLFLSILAQIGDLVFSSIKRYFNKKDFSNIMPGHGGILDRMDSIIFVMLGFLFFISLI